MYHRVLLAIDDDRLAMPALPGLAALATCWHAGVHVVHVRAAGGDGGRDRGHREVSEAVETLRAQGVSTTGEIRMLDGRDVAREIGRVGAYATADVVAVVDRGQGELAAALAGSTSHRLAATLELPVLFLPRVPSHPAARRFAVVAGIRDQLDSAAVVQTALDAVAGMRADVRLVHVAGPRPAAAELFQAHRTMAQALLGAARTGLLTASSVVLTGRGPVSEQLAEESGRMAGTLLVLGSRRPSALDALVHGSVAYDLARLGPAPILLARRPVTELVIN
jgi:nucleotide-binding universal stress UspA family protein